MSSVVTRKDLMTAVILEGLTPSSDELPNFCLRWLRQRLPEAHLGLWEEWSTNFVTYVRRLEEEFGPDPDVYMAGVDDVQRGCASCWGMGYWDRPFSTTEHDMRFHGYDAYEFMEEDAAIAAYKEGLTLDNPGFESFSKAWIDVNWAPINGYGYVWSQQWHSNFMSKIRKKSYRAKLAKYVAARAAPQSYHIEYVGPIFESGPMSSNLTT